MKVYFATTTTNSMPLPSRSSCRFHAFLFAAALLGLQAGARSDEPPLPKWEVIAECQMVVLPQKAALPLLSDLQEDAKIDAAFAKLQEMIGRGEATLAANLMARGTGDNKLVAQSVEEVRYPTEFDPPNLPSEIPKEKPADFLKAWPAVSITPTAFETRNVGTILELTVTAVSLDGQWITADVAPQHVRLPRHAKYDAGILASGDRLTMEQPLFTVLKSACTLQAHSGQRLLVGVHKVPGEENSMELFFLRIRAQKVGAAR